MRALKEKRARSEAGRFLVEGGKMVEEALAYTAVYCAVVDDEREARYAPLLATLDAAGVEVLISPGRVLEALCETRTPQGIVAAVGMPAPLPWPIEGPIRARLVALDGVQDPGNVGTILRAADAAGFGGALLSPACADVFSGKALRASMGSVFRVGTRTVPDLAGALGALRGAGYAVLSTQLDGQDFFERGALPERLALVIGSEGGGVSAEVSAVATHRFRLPMLGGAESLNAAVAAGIMLYDLTREQGGFGVCK
jgi:TrmH family RNA methyltransferase